MISSCSCPIKGVPAITANCPITLSDYNFADQLTQNRAVFAPITFEEIVIVVIKRSRKSKQIAVTNTTDDKFRMVYST